MWTSENHPRQTWPHRKIAKFLISNAMRNVRIVVCMRCHGSGTIGLKSFPAICPECRGCGETTINTQETHA